MPLNRFAIEDYDHGKFGALIKKWALGQKTPPTTIEELKTQLADEDIDAIWPTGANELQSLNIIQGEVQRLDIRLPPAVLIQESEAWLQKPGNRYPLPRYYEDIFGGLPNIADTPTAKINFHNMRVGDYTVANCA